MKDINQQLKKELSELINKIKIDTRNKQKHAKTQRKIERLQKNQQLLLQHIEQLSKII